MPNWCHNTLTVRGEAAAVEAYREHVLQPPRRVEADPGFEAYDDPGQPLTFQVDAPVGEREDWYESAIEKWGTKWDASFGEPFVAMGGDAMNPDATADALGVQHADGVVIYKFDTAWAPPVPWMVTSSGVHRELEFELRFGEVGHGYAGSVRAVGGVIVEECELPLEDVLAPEEMWF